MELYERKIDDNGQPYLETNAPGHMLSRLPLLNKGTAFTAEERRDFGLTGWLPPHVTSLAEQVEQSYKNFSSFQTPLDKHVFLRVLQDRNETLFYALVAAHLEEMMPIIYTPTVAQGVEQFSHIYRYPRGLILSTENIDQVDTLLANAPFPEVKLVVATDAEGILGIGDQGVGGLAICIGKLSLYTAAAGIDPAFTLPIGLDVGTNREDLLADPLYLGVRHRRLEGKPYYDFIEKFVSAFKRRFPNALLQWEDFSKQKAFDVLVQYQEAHPSFNDDIQGTGAVVLAGLLATMRKTGQKLSDQVVVIHGAGAGGIGVARQIANGFELEGVSREKAREQIFVLDSKGLVLTDRVGIEPYKLEFAHEPARVAEWKIQGRMPDLLETVQHAKVTMLIGLSGQYNAFSEEIVRATAANTPHPVVFALSNPTANCEALPEDVYQWTDGKAIVATGSPFPDVVYEGKSYPVGQGNNAFIFPGLGLGVMLSGARRVTEKMLTAAAVALDKFTTNERIAQGGVYPRIEQLREASKHVAVAVIRQAMSEGLARNEVPERNLEEFVENGMWKAEYVPIRRKQG